MNPTRPTEADFVPKWMWGLAFVALLIGVGPWFLATRDHVEGVAFQVWRASGDFESVKAGYIDSHWFMTVGLVWLGLKGEALLGIPLWLTSKVWLAIMVVIIGLETRNYSRDVLGATATSAAMVLIFIWVTPLWADFFAYSRCLGHVTSLAVLMVGQRHFNSNSNRTAICGFSLILISFQLASCLVMVIALQCVRILVKDRTNRISLGRLLVLFVAAFCFYMLFWKWYRPVEQFANYNNLLNLHTVAGWKQLLKYYAAYASWMLLMLPFALAYLFASVRKPNEANTLSKKFTFASSGMHSPLFMLLGLFIAAAFPYAMAGLGSPLFIFAPLGLDRTISLHLALPDETQQLTVWFEGWHMRQNLMTSVPLAISGAWLFSRVSTRHLAVAAPAALVWLSLWTLPAHWAKLQRTAADISIVNALKKTVAPAPGLVGILIDSEQRFRAFLPETNAMFIEAFGKENWVVYLAPDRPPVREQARQQAVAELQTAVSASQSRAALFLYRQLPKAPHCETTIKVKLPDFSLWEILHVTGFAPETVPAAQIVVVEKSCGNS